MRVVVAAVGTLTLVVLLLMPSHVEAPLLGVAYRVAPPALEPYVWQIVEWGGNVAAFAALSGLLCLPMRPRIAFVIAVLLSAACEFAQLVIPSRQASIGDFVLNSLGAALACGLCSAVDSLRRRTLQSRAQRPVVTR